MMEKKTLSIETYTREQTRPFFANYIFSLMFKINAPGNQTRDLKWVITKLKCDNKMVNARI